MTTEKLTRAPFLGWPASLALREVLHQADLPARFVGGCVRDALLGRPVIEADLATSARPEAVMEAFKRAGWKVIPTGLKHGTVTVRNFETSFEITTLRRDLQCDGRHAKVEYTNQWEEDAARRDFTINALYADFSGNVFDYHGGLKDLKKKTLRFIGDAEARITEDALRMLRLFRFEAQLGFIPDAKAVAACAQLAANVARLSGERIHQEMRKLLAAAVTDLPLQHLRDTGLLREIGCEEVDIAMGAMALREQELGVTPEPIVRLACMLSALSAVEERRSRIAKLKSRWVLSNAEVETLQRLLLFPALLHHESSEKEQKRTIRTLQALYPAFLLLSWTQEARREGVDTPEMCRAYQAMHRFAQTWQVPVFPVTGDDLIALGIAPGEALGRMLKQLEAQWEAQDYQPTKTTLLELATQQ